MSEFVRQSERLLLNCGLVLILIVLSIACGVLLGRKHSILPEAPRIHSMSPHVIQLERLGQLTMTRVHITDVLWAEGEGFRGSWLITGDALLSCDVSQATIDKVNFARRTATIRLPALHVTSARIDHEKTKTWNVEKTTWLPWRWGDQGVMRDAAMSHAQKLVETAAGSEHHLNAARAQTDLLVRQLYGFVEWDVDVEWVK